MSDELKKYVDARRGDWEQPFDVESGWKEMEGRLHPKKPNWRWMVAAAVGVLMMVSVGLMISPADSGGNLAEWQEAELYYITEITHMEERIVSKGMDPQVLHDLDRMDKAFADIKEDLGEDVDNERVVEALLAQYRLKMEILEEILNELQDENEISDRQL